MTSREQRQAVAEKKRLGLEVTEKIDEKTGKAIQAGMSDKLLAVPFYLGSGTTITHHQKNFGEADSGAGAAAVAEAIKRAQADAAAAQPDAVKCMMCGTTHSLRAGCAKVKAVGAAAPPPKPAAAKKTVPAAKIGHDALRRDRADDDDPLMSMLEDEFSSAVAQPQQQQQQPAQRKKLDDIATVQTTTINPNSSQALPAHQK